MPKKLSSNNKKHSHNHNQEQETSIFDTMSTEELIEFAAERLAKLLWKTWLFKKNSNNKKPESDRDGLN